MYRIGLWCCCLMWCLPLGVKAAEHLSDHEVFCRQEPATACLDLIQQGLAQAEPFSVRWYQLKSVQLDFFFDKHLYEALAQQTSQLLQLEDVPAIFRTQLYFYQAKILHGKGQRIQALHYADLAANDLEQQFQSFADPLRLLELANLHSVMGEQAQAWKLLMLADSRYGKSKDPIFAFELHTNKALVQQANGRLADAAYSRKLALDVIQPTGETGKITVAYGNLGRTYQLLGQYGLALQYYQQSLLLMQPGADDVRRQMHLLRAVQLNCQLQQYVQARQLLAQMDASLLEVNYRDDFSLLQQQLESDFPLCAAD